MRTPEEIERVIEEAHRLRGEMLNEMQLLTVASCEARIAALEWALERSDSPIWSS